MILFEFWLFKVTYGNFACMPLQVSVCVLPAPPLLMLGSYKYQSSYLKRHHAVRRLKV